MITIRKSDANDLATAENLLGQLASAMGRDSAGLSKQAFADGFSAFLDQTRGVVLLATDDTGVLGMISVSFNLALRYGGEYAQIEELIVTAAARGKHAGSGLVRAAIEEARRRGCKEIGLYAVERNVPFYEALGFGYVGPELRLGLTADDNG